MAKNTKDITMNEEERLAALRQDFFSYYRRMRSNLFSDTEIVYETKLTPEIFDLKLQQLSQDKKQSEFENFAIAVASRLITPNIKPQTGPDGGGDGKVDEHILLIKQYRINGGCQKVVLATRNGLSLSAFKRVGRVKLKLM